MKKLVPFKKEIIFKSNLSEITSISLEHSLNIEDEHLISGEFIISGDYRMTDDSINTEVFSFNIPFDIHMDEKYVLDKAIIDINDFYYEIINSKILEVNIEVSIDKLEERTLIEEIEDVMEVELMDEPIVEHYLEEDNYIEENNTLEDRSIEESIKEEIIKEGVCEMENKKEEKIDKLEESRCIEEENIEVKSLFDNVTGEEEYSTYKVCIVREGDSLESIMMRYNISKEQMELYNNLSEIKIGDKLIIPSVKS